MTSTDPTAEARIEALLEQMTLDEKASLTAGDDVWHLPAIERLGIGRLKMSDGPSGVRGERIGTRRSLSFPCGMAVGATWDTDLVGRYGQALAGEARAKGVHLLLGPTVCIPRTPLAGRTFESFAEDAHLSSRLTVAYVTGVQGEGVGCCVKHFAVNDQEHERMTISAEVDEATLREVHLRSFEAAVTEAGAWSVMSAYNRLNGTYCGEHPWLLGSLLKEEWAFDGVVVSDWFGTHSTVEASMAGLDVEMPGPAHHLGPKVAEAVRAGEIPEEVLDDHARRILRLAQRTGLLDQNGPKGLAQDPEDLGRRRVARDLAVASTVLLRNEGVLPLDLTSVTTVAVIGPNSDLLEMGGGGSSEVFAHRRTSFVEELRERVGHAVEVLHERGCDIDRGLPDLDMRLVEDGFDVEYFASPDLDGEAVEVDRLWTGRLVSLGDPVPGVPVRSCAIRAVGTLRADISGRWKLGIANAGRARLLLDGEVIVDNTNPGRGAFFYGMGSDTVSAALDLVAGEPHELTVELINDFAPVAGFAVSAERPAVEDELERAVRAASRADVAIVVVGSNGQWESEGEDRKGLSLPGDQDDLVRRIVAANPNTVVVLNAGAPVLLPWVDEIAGLVMVWYPGEEGGAALADIVVGLADPGGRLPITFPRQLDDVAAHGFYPGEAGKVTYGEGTLVGYRHFDARDIEPSFCFGHGLSYAQFVVGEPVVFLEATETEPIARVEVAVSNTSERAGTEVVQVYAGRTPGPGRALCGFAKIELLAGETELVGIDIDPRAFSRWNAASRSWVVVPGRWTISVGTSSRNLPHQVPITVS